MCEKNHVTIRRLIKAVEEDGFDKPHVSRDYIIDGADFNFDTEMAGLYADWLMRERPAVVKDIIMTGKSDMLWQGLTPVGQFNWMWHNHPEVLKRHYPYQDYVSEFSTREMEEDFEACLKTAKFLLYQETDRRVRPINHYHHRHGGKAYIQLIYAEQGDPVTFITSEEMRSPGFAENLLEIAYQSIAEAAASFNTLAKRWGMEDPDDIYHVYLAVRKYMGEEV